MNVRKPTDYSNLFAALDTLMIANLPQIKLYCEIGRLVSHRPEKGAAVAAAEYLQSTYPDTAGFSPRNLRRMRDFYRTYESAPEAMAVAMTIGWTQNIVILDAELTVYEKLWYIRAVEQFGWSKLKLVEQIVASAHREIVLDLTEEACYLKKIWPIPPGSLEALFSRAFWHENAEPADRFQLIERMAADYIREGLAGQEHRTEMIDREKLVSFAIKPGIVFLHARCPAKETRLSFLTLKHRMEWNEFKVHTVVMALFREEDRNFLFHLKMHLCYESFDVEQLQKCKTKQELIPLLLSNGVNASAVQ